MRRILYANRHSFLVRSICLCALAVSSSASPQATTAIHLRIGLVKPVAPNPAAAAIARGVELGVSEAVQTGKLFGADIELFEATGSGERAVAMAASLSGKRKVQILIASSAADAERLAQFAESRHLLFLNVASRKLAFRAACRRHTFHVEASDAMYGNAARLAGSAGQRAADQVGTDAVLLWAPGLARFGASELNRRYQGRYNLPMDGSAWAGWAAVKMVSEAALRTRSTDPGRLLSYFESGPTQFDGHKGWPLTFRRSDHQLRQPLYVAVPSRTQPGAVDYRDVPDLRGLSGGGMAGNAAQILDRLNTGTQNNLCQWGSP